jgi:hypothetical protein
MAKINPFKLSRPAEVSDTRTFTDPANPDKPIELTFRSSPDFSEALAAQTLAAKLIREHVDDGRKPDDPEKTWPVPISFGGREVRITPEICAAIAVLMTLEAPPAPDQPYCFDEWAIINACAPTAFGEMYFWAQDLMEKASGAITTDAKGRPEVPNDSAASTDNSSAPPPPTTP